MIITKTLQTFFPQHRIYTSPKNYNGELWLSLSIFGIESFDPRIWSFLYTFFTAIDLLWFGKKPYDIIVLEYGIDTPWEMDFMLSIVQPDFGVFTAVDAVHSEQFGDPDAIAREEVKMALSTKSFVFLNEADTYALQLMDKISVDMMLYQTQWHESKAPIRFANDFHLVQDGKVRTILDISIKDFVVNVDTNLVGKANYGYIWVGLAIADIIHYQFWGKAMLPLLDACVLDFDMQAWRLWLLEGFNDHVVVDSSYNASPSSVRKVIDTARVLQKDIYPDHAVWFVLWDMRELWDLTESEHRKLASYVHGLSDRIFLVGEYMHRYMYDELLKIGVDSRIIERFRYADELGDFLRNELSDKDMQKVMLIFKWSQNTIFLEEAIKKVLDKPEDIQKLPRQSARWIKQKDQFFAKRD